MVGQVAIHCIQGVQTNQGEGEEMANNNKNIVYVRFYSFSPWRSRNSEEPDELPHTQAEAPWSELCLTVVDITTQPFRFLSIVTAIV